MTQYLEEQAAHGEPGAEACQRTSEEPSEKAGTDCNHEDHRPLSGSRSSLFGPVFSLVVAMMCHSFNEFRDPVRLHTRNQQAKQECNLDATSRYYVHIARYKEIRCRVAPRPLSSDDGPLPVFALELRALRDSLGSTGATPDDIADKEGIHRTTIYAALSGKRVPSRDVLAAIIKHWKGDQADWARKRTALENALGIARQLQDQPGRPTRPRQPRTELEPVGLASPSEGDPSTRLHTGPHVSKAEQIERLASDIRNLMEARGLNPKQLASRSHLSKSTISNVLSGRRLVSWEVLEVVLHVLGQQPGTRSEWRARWSAIKKSRQLRDQPDQPARPRQHHHTAPESVDLTSPSEGDPSTRLHTGPHFSKAEQIRRLASDIRNLMDDRGAYPKLLAYRSQVSRSTISNVLGGRRLVSWDVLHSVLMPLGEECGPESEWQARWTAIKRAT